jgi:hypothetical protein
LRRVGQKHLDFYSGYKKKFANPQGVAAVKLRFNDEPGRADDEEITVYGINSGTGEIFYNKSMVSLGFYGAKGRNDGEFMEAVGIGADAEGNVVVGDRGNQRVVHLRNDRNELKFVRAYGIGRGGSPNGVALEEGTVYITDPVNDRIVVTDLEGRLIREIGPGTDLVQPFGIAVISSPEWNYYSSRFIVVTDSLHKRLSTYTLDGRLLRRSRFHDVSGDDGGFYFVGIDYYSNVYVTDTATDCIYKFDRGLHYLTRVGGEDELNEPRGLAIHRRFGQVFVAEKAGARYYWVGTEVGNLRCKGRTVGEAVAFEVSFLLTEHSEVTVNLNSKGGNVLHTFVEKAIFSPGIRREVYSIDSRDLPCPIAECDYVLSVTARPTYSSRKYHQVERSTPVRPE